jgi:hypothetical protein
VKGEDRRTEGVKGKTELPKRRRTEGSRVCSVSRAVMREKKGLTAEGKERAEDRESIRFSLYFFLFFIFYFFFSFVRGGAGTRVF